METHNTEKLLNVELKIINIGAQIFYESLKEQGIEVIHVEWQPPAGGDIELIELLDKLS